MDWSLIQSHMTIGITAGASAPEDLVSDFISYCGELYTLEIKEITVREENVKFNLPRMNLS